MEWLGIGMIAGIAAVLAGAVAAFAAGPLALVGAFAIAIGAILIGRALRRGADGSPPDVAAAVSASAIAQPRVEDVLGALDDPMLLVEGRFVVRANAAAVATLGDHVVGEDIRLALRHPAAAELFSRDEAMEIGAVEVIGLGDRDRHWTLTVHPLGAATRLVQLRDRTASHTAERMRVDFVANASHELRTPLSSLIGFIETLEDANGSEDGPVRQRFLTIMAGEARRMQRLVDDLISLSRIEADKYRAPADAVPLGALARETADALRNGTGRIELQIEDHLPAVAGDRAQLSQLLHNLVGNALKYGDTSRPVRIVIARDPGGMVRLSVADEGEGIPPEHLPRLTERFYRVDPGRSRAAGGTGLGLAIVKHIVERHRGRLDIASTLGFGTTVTVLLPALVPRPPEIDGPTRTAIAAPGETPARIGL
jgi:two-component system phosphate regulon sensor histidine kinase PhoR